MSQSFDAVRNKCQHYANITGWPRSPHVCKHVLNTRGVCLEELCPKIPVRYSCKNCEHFGNKCPPVEQEYCCEDWTEKETGQSISQTLGLM